MAYNKRHGGPYDRGSADSWYRRYPEPHYWTGGSYQGIHITEDRMTKEEVNDYWAGFDENESDGCHKEW
tara:strand:+ start:8783 stop:8989 length:207 start_codon:yes stop_codon:yes gene_type:complete